MEVCVEEVDMKIEAEAGSAAAGETLQPQTPKQPDRPEDKPKDKPEDKPKDDNDGKALDKPKDKPKKKKRSAASYAAEFFIKVVLTIVGVWLLCTYVISVHVNHSNASYPMIKDGDLCISYRLGELRDGDEVSYIHDGKVCFGRIAAQAGDSVEIKNGYVSVEGYGVLEDVVYETTEEGSLIEYPYTVPDNCIFVLNDFRDDVSDSRSFGAIDKSEIEGKVVFVMRRRGI